MLFWGILLCLAALCSGTIGSRSPTRRGLDFKPPIIVTVDMPPPSNSEGEEGKSASSSRNHSSKQGAPSVPVVLKQESMIRSTIDNKDPRQGPPPPTRPNAWNSADLDGMYALDQERSRTGAFGPPVRIGAGGGITGAPADAESAGGHDGRLLCDNLRYNCDVANSLDDGKLDDSPDDLGGPSTDGFVSMPGEIPLYLYYVNYHFGKGISGVPVILHAQGKWDPRRGEAYKVFVKSPHPLPTGPQGHRQQPLGGAHRNHLGRRSRRRDDAHQPSSRRYRRRRRSPRRRSRAAEQEHEMMLATLIGVTGSVAPEDHDCTQHPGGQCPFGLSEPQTPVGREFHGHMSQRRWNLLQAVLRSVQRPLSMSRVLDALIARLIARRPHLKRGFVYMGRVDGARGWSPNIFRGNAGRERVEIYWSDEGDSHPLPPPPVSLRGPYNPFRTGVVRWMVPRRELITSGFWAGLKSGLWGGGAERAIKPEEEEYAILLVDRELFKKLVLPKGRIVSRREWAHFLVAHLPSDLHERYPTTASEAL